MSSTSDVRVRPSAPFRSFSGTIASDARIFRPGTPEDLSKVVAREAQRGSIRAVGGGFSSSPLVPADGALISTEAFRRVLRFEPDADRPYVEMEAGASLWELVEAVAPFGLRPIMPSLFPFPTLAGLVSVGGHGVGHHAGCFADHVDAIELVDARGERRRLERGDAAFDAATTSLGCFGVVYSLRVRLERDHRVRMRTQWIPVDRFLSDLDDLLRSHDAVEIFMMPGARKLALLTFERTTAACTPAPFGSHVRTEVDDLFAHANVLLGRALGPRAPGALAAMMGGAFERYYAPRTRVEWASTAYHFETCYPPNRNCCYAFDWSDAVPAFARLAAALDAMHGAGRTPLTLPIHARFTGASSSWLAPAYGRRTVQIDMTTHVETRDGDSFYRRMEDEWLDLPSARPHWGKLHFQPGRLRARYPNFDRFESVRAGLDPDGVFLNAYTRELGLGQRSRIEQVRSEEGVDVALRLTRPEEILMREVG